MKMPAQPVTAARLMTNPLYAGFLTAAMNAAQPSVTGCCQLHVVTHKILCKRQALERHHFCFILGMYGTRENIAAKEMP